MGAVEEKLIADLSRAGQPLPDKIQNAPELTQGLEMYYNGFQQLSSCRSYGMSVGPIPWTAIDHYCQAHQIEDEQREDFFSHVQTLDSEYRNYVENKAKKDKK